MSCILLLTTALSAVAFWKGYALWAEERKASGMGLLILGALFAVPVLINVVLMIRMMTS